MLEDTYSLDGAHIIASLLFSGVSLCYKNVNTLYNTLLRARNIMTPPDGNNVVFSFLNSFNPQMNHVMRKPTLYHIRTTMAQIRLRIHAV